MNKSLEDYQLYKEKYISYTKDVENTKYAKSSGRYNIELSMLKVMKKLATECNLQDELVFISEHQKSAVDALAQMGLSLKIDD